ncbi:MAG TPA: hypothetical protein PLW07_05010, partial [bacterium]|nr:hypothetical protein [bacterium]
FIGIGIKNLSMAPAAIPQIKQLIRRISYERAKELSEKVFIFSTHKEIFEFLKKNIEKDLL